MNDKNIFSYKHAIVVTLVSLVVYLFQHFGASLSEAKIVFCDVGQGDSAYIRVANMDILVDVGPNKSALLCLGKYMPILDREIELVLISHTDTDHLEGLKHVSQKYLIKKIITDSEIYKYSNIGLGDFKIVPKNEYDIQGLATDNNDLSSVFTFTNGKFKVLFTGDINLTKNFGLIERSIGKLDILKVPHHGSRYNLNNKFLELADPYLSVISVGKNNKYGHPAKEVLSMIKALKVKSLRTDEEGDIVVSLFSNYYQVSTQKSGSKFSKKYSRNNTDERY